MGSTIRLEDIYRAYDARDPDVVNLVIQLSEQSDPTPETPIREGALTFDGFLRELQSWNFRRKTRPEQAHYRIETLKALEAPDAEVPLPDRLRLHEFIMMLWGKDDIFSRTCLIQIIARVPLVYGPWRAFKKIFKESEAKRDTEVYGALAARFDMELGGYRTRVTKATLAYCCRRAWRFLRRMATQLPATYADACCDFLIHYNDGTSWNATWISNHIFYHESKKYSRNRWSFGWRERPTPGDLKNRAYPELWKRSPRPLFSLLERAQADAVREFATAALKTDFRQLLREVEPSWVVRLVAVESKAIHDFVVWILRNVPRFEQAQFRDLGLHDAVLRLFDSPSSEARAYAAEYARTHARDLPVAELIRLANNENEAVRKLAQDLLGERDPRTDVGLEAWGQLLESSFSFKLASNVIPKSFGAKELTLAWFQDRLLSNSNEAFEFAKGLLPKIHPLKDIPPSFWGDLLKRLDQDNYWKNNRVINFANGELSKRIEELDQDFLRWLLVFPSTSWLTQSWVQQGKLQPQAFGASFLKALAFHPEFEVEPIIAKMKVDLPAWASAMNYDGARAGVIFGWLGDVRKFAPSELGMDWLMKLVARSEENYHNFAVETMIKSFKPSDFAPKKAEAKADTVIASTAVVDLEKASFLFTGKMATMTREVAETKVKEANGIVAGSVTAKLHYLVIGDEGSPLYGQGKKGSKQTKAEELNEGGANIRIISETAFLSMLAGRKLEASSDDTLAGSECLWEMVVSPGPADAPVASFARQYIRRHHSEICQAETDRPVDVGSEIPQEFFTFERVSALFGESRKPVRDFSLLLARYEFARWNPGVDDLLRMSEIQYVDVRRFVAHSLLADDASEHRRYRIDATKLDASAVYRFCESADEETRMLGMTLIQRQPRLRLPEELFRLTESPDRRVRAFVIRTLWSLYRDRGVTEDWKPPVPPAPTVGAKARKEAEKAAENRGDGVMPRPEQWPAEKPTLSQFLRRILFELPPGRPEASREQDETPEANAPTPKEPSSAQQPLRLKPIPARRAKLDLVEVLRDLAFEEEAFAQGILPLLDEFLLSRGKSEREACLVAVTRIRHKWGHSTAMTETNSK